MTALIFGINGQDGFYLNQLLSKHRCDVIGVSRSNPSWVKGDVSNYALVSELIKRNKPDYIFHLAANSTVKFDVLFENHETISTGTLNILRAAYDYSRESKIFISGSGLQFKNIGLPIRETDEFDPNSAYSNSRIHSIYSARFFRNLGLKVFVGYFFNHDSPLRLEKHVNQKVIQAFRRIAAGSAETLQLGDISVKKEFGFSGDIVNAVWKLVNNDAVFEAVIGTGRAYSIRDWLDICGDAFSLDWKRHVKFETSNTNQFPLVSYPETINGLDWRPEVSIHQLAELMINNK